MVEDASSALQSGSWKCPTKKPKSTSMPEPATNGQDATKQSIEKKDNKAIADSISKDVKKAKG